MCATNNLNNPPHVFAAPALDNRRPWFFGCWGRIGHHLWSPDGTLHRHQSAHLPWPEVDGELTPGNRNRYGDVDARDQVEGMARLHHAADWTAVAWWDRSVDKRPGSNAALFVPGTVDMQPALAIGAEHFPSIFARFTYDIRAR